MYLVDQDASAFINDTLNNVLSMQQIEEGLSLQLLLHALYVLYMRGDTRVYSACSRRVSGGSSLIHINHVDS